MVRSLQAARPLVRPSAGFARVRAVAVADYVPRRVRWSARVAEVGSVVVLVAGVAAFLAGFYPLHAAWTAVGACSVLVSAVGTEIGVRRLAAAPEPADDEEQLFLQDALRCQQLVAAYLSVVGSGLIVVLAWALYLELLLVDAYLDWVALFALALGLLSLSLHWVGRPAPRWYQARLWDGQVPDGLRPVAAEAGLAGQPTPNGVTT